LQNNRVLLEELYQKYSGKIKGMVLQNNGTEVDAADIFQEALICLYHKAKSENFTLTCPLDAFLYLICKNKWISELNRRKSRQTTFSDTTALEDMGEDSFRIEEECRMWQARKDLIGEKLAELGEGAKELLRLSWSGKSMEEVAGLLHVSYGYARKKKCAAMSKLITLIRQSPQFHSLKW
jgi:RNA polymerase sigma factor (sigma-70 family)